MPSESHARSERSFSGCACPVPAAIMKCSVEGYAEKASTRPTSDTRDGCGRFPRRLCATRSPDRAATPRPFDFSGTSRPVAEPAGLQRQIAASAVDTSHFTGQAWRRGRAFPSPVPLERYLQHGRLVSTNNLRRRLLRDGIVPPRCAVCSIESWNGNQVPLELDHVNGDRRDNRLVNLRVLCPNCHAQTSTWRGRNIGAYRAGMNENE